MKKKILWLLSLMLLLAACGNTVKGVSEEDSPTAVADDEITIYLVRHGKTWFNTMNQVQGFCDSPLTEDGENQAKLVGAGLREVTFSSAFSNDLGRQRNTAKLILAENVQDTPQIIENNGFREKNFGSFEGRSNDEMNIAVAEALNWDYPKESDALWDFLKEKLDEEELADKVAEVDPTQTAETYEEMLQRVGKAMPEMIKEVEKNGGGNVLIVSSGGIIPILLESVASGAYSGEKIANCSVTTLTYKNGAYTIGKIGDTTFVDQEK